MKQQEYNIKALDMLYKSGVDVDKTKTRSLSYICKKILSKKKRTIRKEQKNSGFYNWLIKNYVDNKGSLLGKFGKLYYNQKKKSYAELAKEFYLSQEWKELRYSVLKEQGGKCQLCGRSRKDGVVLHVDHIIPLSKDWSKRLDKDNLQVLCEDCNLGKSNKDSICWI